jgi:hypothetical protein
MYRKGHLMILPEILYTKTIIVFPVIDCQSTLWPDKGQRPGADFFILPVAKPYPKLVSAVQDHMWLLVNMQLVNY